MPSILYSVRKIALWGLLPFLFAGCISRLDNPTEGQQVVIIEGVLTNSPGERSLRVGLSGNFAGEFTPLAAEGVVYENGELWATLNAPAPGRLELPTNARIVEGATYEVEVTTGGATYRSRPQTIPPTLTTDSLSVNVSTRLEGTNSDGITTEISVVELYAHVTLPNETDNPTYYRWFVEEVWDFWETDKPSALIGEGEEDTVKICYLSAPVTQNPVTLFSSDGLDGGQQAVLIGARPIGEPYLHSHIYSAYLHAIDQEAYEFYSRNQILAEQNGQLFNEIPGPAPGNVLEVDNLENQVLGYVSFAVADTLRLRVEYADLKFRLVEFCTEGGGCKIPPSPSGEIDTTFTCKCWDCDEIYGDSTLAQPDYWND